MSELELTPNDLCNKATNVIYFAKTSVVDWNKVGQRWREFELGSIANGDFPAYGITFKDKAGKKIGSFDNFSTGGTTYLTDSDTVELFTDYQYNTADRWLTCSFLGANGNELTPNWVLSLNQGTNLIGVRINEYFQTATETNVNWIDFKWLTIVRGEICTNVICQCEFPVDYAALKRVSGSVDNSGNYGYWFTDAEGMRQGGFISYWFGNTNKVLSRGCYLDNLKEGLWTSYYDNGIVYEIAYYTAGVRTGDYESFHFMTGSRWEWGRYADYDESGGTYRFSVMGIANLTWFAQDIYKHSTAVSTYLWNRLSTSTRDLISEYVKDSHRRSRASLQTTLAQELDALLEGPLIYDESAFSNVRLSEATGWLLDRNPSGNDLVLLNRLLLEDAYPGHLARERKTGLWSRCDESGKLEYQWTYLPDGFVHHIGYYDGRRSGELTFIDDQHEKIGLQTGFYDNGQVSSEIRWSAPYVQDGVSREWYRDGKPKSKYNFQNNILHGEYLRWYENGNLAEKGTYENGQRKDDWISWNEDGTVQQRW